jgi:hypothetical protein
MATSPNFNWPEPDNTDLVKNGALAIRTAVNAIDTSLVDLKGGTTGQVLAKASGTDMDFTWVTDAAGDITGVTAGTGISGGGTSGTVTVTNSMATAIDAKGDLIGGTGADTFSRLAVGTNGQVLTADSAEATGLKWATPAGGGGKVLQVVQGLYSTSTANTSTTPVDTGLSASITPSSASSKILVFVTQWFEKSTGNVANAVVVNLLRGATQITTGGTGAYFYTNSDSRFRSSAPLMVLDSPSTTSATTYKTIFASNAAGQAVYANVDNYQASIVLMEIGA